MKLFRLNFTALLTFAAAATWVVPLPVAAHHSAMPISAASTLSAAGDGESSPHTREADSLAPTSGSGPKELSLHLDAPVYFPIGQSEINSAFEDNAASLGHFIASLREILANPDYVVRRITVVGTASPDGDQAINLALAAARAEAMARYICEQTSFSDGLIERVNGGENWSGLRAMVSASRMEHRGQVLEILDNVDDRDRRKYKLMFLNENKPWTYMYQHFFPDLRIGAGGEPAGGELSAVSRENWDILRERIAAADPSVLTGAEKQQMLEIIDNEPSVVIREQKLRTLNGGMSFRFVQVNVTNSLLNTLSGVSRGNWRLLRAMVAESQMPAKAAVLELMDRTPITQGRWRELMELDGGSPYLYIREHFFPGLLVAIQPSEVAAQFPTADATTTLSQENWTALREMIELSEMPDKAAVLEIIASTPDFAEREQKLRAIGGGAAYAYIRSAFFPELLSELSPAAQDNWRQMEKLAVESDLPTKTQVLAILRSGMTSDERIAALQALDQGDTYIKLQQLLMPHLLQSTEASTGLHNGSGMSVVYERRDAGDAAAPMSAAAARVHRAELRAREELAAEKSREELTSTVASGIGGVAAGNVSAFGTEAAGKQNRQLKPLIAIKTDLLLWAGVMPGFEVKAPMVNLSAEVYFAGRWSVEVGGVYSNWNALTGQKMLWAVSGLDLEPRFYLRNNGLCRGFYVGIYGQWGSFDVQDNELRGQTGSYFGSGVSVGYVQTLSRHWYFELGVRGGYRSAKSKFYDIEPPHFYYNNTQTVGKFVPQVRVNFMYRFGRSRK